MHQSVHETLKVMTMTTLISLLLLVMIMMMITIVLSFSKRLFTGNNEEGVC